MLSEGLGVAAILRKDIREHKKRKRSPELWSCRKKGEVWIRERVKIGKERVLPCLPVGLNCPGTSLYIIWWIWQQHCCRAELSLMSHRTPTWISFYKSYIYDDDAIGVTLSTFHLTASWCQKIVSVMLIPIFYGLLFLTFFRDMLQWCWYLHAAEPLQSLHGCIKGLSPLATNGKYMLCNRQQFDHSGKHDINFNWMGTEDEYLFQQNKTIHIKMFYCDYFQSNQIYKTNSKKQHCRNTETVPLSAPWTEAVNWDKRNIWSKCCAH